MNLINSMLLLNKHKQIWLWPSCNNHPKTLSFRVSNDEDTAVINTNKESLVEAEVEVTTLGSFFTNSSETASVSTESDECSALETIVREARSDRLFFEPDLTSSILETQGSGGQCMLEVSGHGHGHGGGGGGGGLPYKESFAMVMESDNPYDDFRKSMEEMVEIHGLKDWDCLEELLGWYLRMNEEDNHEYIVGAFVDLVAGGGSGGGGGDGGGGGGLFVDHTIASFSSAASTFSSPTSSTNGN
ncbi:putative transcription factor OFP family [Helianthus debilis subsp. tardiflorus]